MSVGQRLKGYKAVFEIIDVESASGFFESVGHWGSVAINWTINGPTTLFGFIAAETSGGDCGLERGIVICAGVNGWADGFMPRSAITLGGTVLFEDERSQLAESFIEHEVSHTYQWSSLGPMFPATYLAAEVIAQTTGTCNLLESSTESNWHGC